MIGLTLAAGGSSEGSTPVPAATGTLLGQVTASGGPATARANKLVSALQNAPWAARVTVTRQQTSHDVVAATSSDRSGHYTLTLMVGTYWVSSECSIPQQVSVRSEEVTRMDIACSVP